MDTKYDQLITQFLGKAVKLFPNNLPAQCFEWATKWTDTLGIPHVPGNPSPFPFENAYEIYTKFGDFQAKYFDRIPNSPTAVPQKGDLPVWDSALNGGAGHVSVADGEGDTTYFISSDQNWNKPIVEKIRHDYKFVLGWLRPKGQQVSTNPTPPSNSTSTSPEIAKWTTYTSALNANKDKVDVNYYTDDPKRIVDDILKYKNSLEVCDANRQQAIKNEQDQAVRFEAEKTGLINEFADKEEVWNEKFKTQEQEISRLNNELLKASSTPVQPSDAYKSSVFYTIWKLLQKK